MTDLAAPPRMRPLGSSGIEVSSLAWGMWRLAGDDVGAASRRVHAALDAGISLLDTADVYGPDNGEPFGAAETLLGRVLAAEPGLRERCVLATKGGIVPGVPYDSSATHLRAAIDASLSRLRSDRLDLWQIHRPDILTHPHEVARTAGDALRAGKIRSFGVSNMTQTQIGALRSFLDVPLVSTQPELSPLSIDAVEDGSLDQAIALDLAVLAWSPLGGGRIANPQTERERAVAAALDGFAEEAGVARTIAALAWLMAHPARPIPIVGSQRPERIAEAAAAYEVSWSRRRWYQVLVASRGVKLP